VLRLRRYEHLLKSHGVKVELEDLHPQDYPQLSKNEEEVPLDDLGRLTMNAPRRKNEEPGSLFFGQSRAHYVEKYAPNQYFVKRSNDNEVLSGKRSKKSSRINQIHLLMRKAMMQKCSLLEKLY
jgi:hypothetical protein